MADWLNSPWSAAFGYGVIVVLAGIVGCREFANRRAASWPTFWFTAAVLALAMGVGRVLHAGGLVADLGRRQARSGGWYEERRALQIIAIGVVVLLAVVIMSVGVRCWSRVRAGYLTIGVLLSALVFYSVIRVVSLHQVDSWLRTNDAGGITFGTLIELVLLAAVVAVTLGRLRSDLAGDDAASPADRVRVGRDGVLR